MTKRSWQRVQPTSLRHAIELCKDYAREMHNLSVERIAEIMDEESHWTVYGWLRDGSIPARKLLGYQHACRCNFITRWLAHAGGDLIIKMPLGRMPDGADVQKLQAVLNDTVGSLIKFATGQMDADHVGHDLNLAMEALAWHRENAQRAQQPELDLEVTP